MKLNEILGIKYPIIQGGMAHIADGTFAAKVSNAGALGVIGSGGMNVEELKKHIAVCKTLTDKPFGVNLMLLNPNVDEMAKVVVEEGVSVVTTGAGNPSKYLNMWHENNIKIFPVVSSPIMAKMMERQGVDGIITEGNEAGGHIGEMTSMTLIHQTKEKVDIPIIAAGGIASGKQMLAAKVLGAVGVQIGTLFLSSEECPIHKDYKKLLLRSKDNNITVVGRINGIPMRLIKNKMARSYLEGERKGMDKMELEKYTLGALKLAVRYGELNKGSFMAGLTVGQIDKVRTLEEILECLIGEYKGELEKIYDELKDRK